MVFISIISLLFLIYTIFIINKDRPITERIKEILKTIRIKFIKTIHINESFDYDESLKRNAGYFISDEYSREYLEKILFLTEKKIRDYDIKINEMEVQNSENLTVMTLIISIILGYLLAILMPVDLTILDNSPELVRSFSVVIYTFFITMFVYSFAKFVLLSYKIDKKTMSIKMREVEKEREEFIVRKKVIEKKIERIKAKLRENNRETTNRSEKQNRSSFFKKFYTGL